MMNFARITSFIFSPVFTLLPMFYILISKSSTDNSYILKWMIFSYTFVLAVALFVVIGVMLGVFSNLDVSKREQRPLLFSFSALIAFCYLTSLLIFNGPKILFIAFFAVALGLIVLAIVNKWLKASIHLATAAAVVMFMGIAYGRYFFLLLLFIPLICWARIKMKEHTLTETVIGTILGAMITLIVYFVSKQFLLGIVYPVSPGGS